jgi:hypothetical protein
LESKEEPPWLEAGVSNDRDTIFAIDSAYPGYETPNFGFRSEIQELIAKWSSLKRQCAGKAVKGTQGKGASSQ